MSDSPAVLITGAAKRIGAVMARRFAAEGWHVVIHYRRSADAARELAASLPSAQVVQCDLADGNAALAMIDRLAGELGDWRALVNSASIFVPDDVTGLDGETYDRAMLVNAKTPAMMAQRYLARACAGNGRRVIHVTDQKLLNSNPDFFSYTMSKHALDATIEMLADGAAHREDRVYGLAPGAILPSHDQNEAETDRSHVLNLLGRKTGADELADAALYLASGTLESGQTIYVDSGQHLLKQPRDVIYLAREKAPEEAAS